MFRTVTFLAAFALALPAGAASAAEKEAQCALQAELMGAVQTARLERVRKNRVTDKLMEQNPDWPAGAAQALPALAEYVYSIRRSDLRQVDLAAQTRATCLQNHDQIQSLKNSVTN